MKLLLTGDSIIARKECLKEPRINAKMKEKMPGTNLVNTAVSGINSGAFYALLPDLVLKAEHCDKLILLLGTNDLAMHKKVPVTQFKKNMSLIISSVICLYYPQNVILISPPAVDETRQKNRINREIAIYTAELIKLAETYNLYFINLFQAMIKRGDLKNLCQAQLNDGLHFGTEGYQLFIRFTGKRITKLKNTPLFCLL